MKISVMFFMAVIAVSMLGVAPVATADGKTVYNTKCATCHGKDGTGNAKLAAMLKVDAAAVDLTDAETAKKTDQELVPIIMDGKDKMPAFKGKLSKDEVSAVVAYIRTLQKK